MTYAVISLRFTVGLEINASKIHEAISFPPSLLLASCHKNI